MLGMISLDVKPSKNPEGKETKKSTKIGVRSTDPYSKIAQHFVNFKMEREVIAVTSDINQTEAELTVSQKNETVRSVSI